MAIVSLDRRWMRGASGSLLGGVRALIPVLVTACPLVVLIYIACSPFFGTRIALFLLSLMIFTGLALLRPVYAAMACLTVGPWLGLTRRLFDSALGVPALDPFLVVIAMTLSLALVTTILSRVKEIRRLVADSLTFRLILIFMVIMAVEIVNPLQGGFTIGLGGALYRLIPMFCVIIVAAGRGSVGRFVLYLMLATAFLQELYGLNQTFLGFNGPEQEFITRSLISGYRAISVGGVIRAFGAFVSAAEYVFYIDAAVGVALAYTVVNVRRRQWHLAALALGLVLFGLVSIILESHRSSLLLVTAAALFVIAAQQVDLKRVAVVFFAIVALAFVIQQNLPTSMGAGSLNRLLSHIFADISGGNILSDPSIQGHVQLVLAALWSGVTSPLGRGLGASSQAAVKFGGGSVSSEFDVTDIIIATGYIGGLLYIAILIRLLMTSVRLFRASGRPEHLAAGAAMVGAMGQMLGPGYYVFPATLLSLVGWLIQEEARHSRHRSLA